MIFDFTPYFLGLFGWFFLAMMVTLLQEEAGASRDRMEASFEAKIANAATESDRDVAIASRALWRASRDPALAAVEAEYASELAECHSDSRAALIRARLRDWRLSAA